MAEEGRSALYHFDAQASFAAFGDVSRFDLSALYTLQHGLARHAERAGGLLHGDEAVAGRLGELRFELIGHADAPGRPRGHLLTGYKAVIEPAMQSRWRDVERRRCRRNSHDLSFGDLRLGLETRDAPVGAQSGDPIGLEAMAAGGRPPLAIENAGDHRVRVEGRQAAHEVQRSFISSNCCWS